MATFGNATSVASFTNNLSTTAWTTTTEAATEGSFIEKPKLILLFITCSAGLWLIYLTFYHSRLLGFVITRFINLKYVKDGYFKVGSVSFSILSGKIMFRDVRYITKDISVRVVDGFVFFKYWIPFEPMDANKPYQHSLADIETAFTDYRLSVLLNGLEYHLYNRCQLYNRLKETFNIDRYGDAAKSVIDLDAEPKAEMKNLEIKQSDQGGLPTWFLELCPAVQIEINNGKVAFGNKTIETTLFFHFESASGMYTTAQPNSTVDHFTHVVKCNGTNVKVMLSPSPGYSGPRDEPPRFMGEGFVVLQSADCRIMYYQDEPGIVPEPNPEGNLNIPDSDPHWGIDVVFTKGTSLCYGPWVDRQRDFLQRFFFPMDFQEMPATKPLAPGQKRLHTGLDVKFEFECEATLDILFSKKRETKAVHVCVDAGSYIRVYQPWTVNEYGYTTSVVAKLVQVEATTGLGYRSLIEAESLDVAVHITFPRVWNQTQQWQCDITISKVSWYFIFAHKWFFQDMIADWSSNYRADLLQFVPYEWAFNIVLKDFEMVWLGNQHNWIDTKSGWQGNAELAFCGEQFDLAFALQFLRFLPEIEEIKFFLQVEKLIARTFIPESNTLRRSFLSLARSHEKHQSLPIRARSSISAAANPEDVVESSDESPSAAAEGTLSGGWRKHTDASTGWVDVMSVPVLMLTLGYVYHPVLPDRQAEVPRDGPLPFDPYELESDVITLELQAGPTALKVFGPLLKVLAAIKENYFGMDQVFHEFGSFSLSKKVESNNEGEQGNNETMINPHELRPLEANIYVYLDDCKVQLTKHCGLKEPSCPVLRFERMTFEMHKTYTETRLQLLLTPMTLLVEDALERGSINSHISRGHLCLSGFQLRGHAMFSGEGLPVGSETLEYGWLLELQFGILTGKVTLPQLESIANWLQTFVFHVVNKENELEAVIPYQRCIHGNQQNTCKAKKLLFSQSPSSLSCGVEQSSVKECESADVTPQGTLLKKTDPSTVQLCLTEDDLKYKFTRVSFDNIDLFLVESACACNLQITPVRLATCSLHSNESSAGASFFIHKVKLRQFVLTPCPNSFEDMISNVHKRSSMYEQDVLWLEAASIQLGPVISDISLATSFSNRFHQQKHFLEMHDRKLQRLWFLWQPSEQYSYKRSGCCGCVGGCSFFGRNVNGPKFFMPGKLDASENDTGVTGFGSEDGFYEDGDLVDANARPLMYSREGSLDRPDSVMDRSPIGSVEAFTRRRYKHGSDSSGSPRLLRANYLYPGPSPQSFTEDGAGEEEEESRRFSRISFGSSLHRANSSVGNMQDRMHYMHNASLPGSKHSLERNTKASKTSFRKPPMNRSLSQLSRESDASFYSCGSLLDEIEMNQRDGIPRPISVESFVSAVEDPIELMEFEDGQVSLSRFVINSPELVSKYSRHVAQLECLNWATSSFSPSNKKKFSLTQNLKETESEETDFTPPGIPQFNYQTLPKLSFPLLVKKSQKPSDEERAEDEKESSSSEGSVFMYQETSLKVPQFQQKAASKGKFDGSSEMVEQNDPDSAQKVRWSFAMNTSNEEGVSYTSSCDNVLDSARTSFVKTNLPKEGTAVIKLAGDFDIFVTPLLLEALNRYVMSIEKQSGVLHPAAVIDMVHNKCMDAAEETFLSCEPDRGSITGKPDTKITEIQRDGHGEKTSLIFLSTSKVNICFLQAASLESKEDENVDVQIPDLFSDKSKSPDVSLLCGTISGVTTKILNVKKNTSMNKSISNGPQEEQENHSKTSLTDPQAQSFEDRLMGKKSNSLQQKSTIGVMNCNSIQFQLRKLCDKKDIENSVTTAIPEEASRAKFKVNATNQILYSRSFDIDSLDKSKSLNVLVLECGVDNIAVEAGIESGNGIQPLSQTSEKQNSMIPNKESNTTTQSKEGRSDFHGFSNPIFQRESGSVTINLPEPQRKSQDSLSQSSSVSDTVSLSSSLTDGNISDIDSDSDQEMRKPLLTPDGSRSKSRAQTDKNTKAGVPEKEVECGQRKDIAINFSNIWMNLASPSSFKAVPANYHLYNSLVTTIVPVVTAWAPLVGDLRQTLLAMENNRKRHINSVVGCLLAQALPDGRLPGKHPVCSKTTPMAKFIQEDYSSQLIYILRRQLSGSRLTKVRNALLIKSGIPDDANLVKGIFALARQWKCFLAGTEKGELAFDGSNSIKRRVVGRGVLTDRDRAILLQEDNVDQGDSNSPQQHPPQIQLSPTSYGETSPTDGESQPLLVKQEDLESGTQFDHSQKGIPNVQACESEQETPLRRPDTLPIPQDPSSIQVSPKASRHLAMKLLQPEPLHESDSDSDATPPSTIRKPVRSGTNQSLHAERLKIGHKKQLSLYSWLSNTPTTSPPSTSSHTRTVSPRIEEENTPADNKKQKIGDKVSSTNTTLFGDMVSVPTSGKKIADEREIFKFLFQSIQLMPTVERDSKSASTLSVQVKLKYLNVDLVEGGFDNLTKKGKEKEANSNKKFGTAKQLFADHEPVFMAKDFDVKVVCDMSSPNDPFRKGFGNHLITASDSNKLTQVRFTVSSSSITQRVNLSLVRLVIQIVDMLDLLLGSVTDETAGDAWDGPPVPRIRLTSSTPSACPVTPQPSTLSAQSPVLPKCWRIMYQVLDLYSSLPKEAKTKGYIRRSIFGATGSADRPSPDRMKEVKIDIEDGNRLSQPNEGLNKQSSVASYSTRDSCTEQEDAKFPPPAVSIFGVVSLPKTRFLATIGGLVLDTQIKDIGVSISHQEEKVLGREGPVLSSVLGHLGKINLVLLEKTKVQTGTVVNCHLSRSQAMYTAASRVDSEKNMAVVTLGVVDIDIPQHPVALHSMMTRSSRAISRHITEIQSQRSVIRSMGSFDAVSPRLSRRFSGIPADLWKQRIAGTPTSTRLSSTPSTPVGQDSLDTGVAREFPQVSFTLVFRGFSLGASLLPSLRAEYKIGRITSSGQTGKKSSFKVSMPQHNLSFTSKIQVVDSNVPSSTVVDLPPVNVSGEFISKTQQSRSPRINQPHRTPTKGHLFARAEIGAFQHSLTTDLLNHLVFVQKSFMKEVSDVVQRVSGESQPVPLWRTASTESLNPEKAKTMTILYSFELKLKGIQVTATTPSSTAVRLDTGVMALEVSNALLPAAQMVSGRLHRSNSHVKLFGKAQVDVNLSLGQFMKSRVIEDECDFQQLAYFKTRIGLRNSFQDGSSVYGTEDKETFLVTLAKPYFYVQQIAFDKAVLVYLNYKNAYEHWNQQRLALNEEVHTATQVVLEKLPQRGPATQLSGSLFLQLTVDRLGVCTPLFTNLNPAQGLKSTDQEPGPAMVLTVEEMLLTCCSSISFVSRGKFKDFCIRFEDKFNTESSEWEPSPSNIVNTFVHWPKLLSFNLVGKVPEGTYELCSKTVRYPVSSDASKAGKWVMSIHWQMMGIEVECDTEIGKCLKSLGQTLTALAGETDIANMESVTDIPDREARKEVNDEDGRDEVDAAKHQEREKNPMKRLEKEMYDQARKVNELRRRSDAENWLVEKEARVLQDLESAVYNEFRRDVRRKFRRHSHVAKNTLQRFDSDKRKSFARKAMTERVRGSRTRSRLRKSDDVDTDAEENEMVEMTAASAPTSPGDIFAHHSRRGFRESATDELDGTVSRPLALSGRLSPSLPIVTTPSQFLEPNSVKDTSPVRRSSYLEGTSSSPRVTFNTSSTDMIQDQTGQRPSTVQQSLDFELDVKVDIKSGICVLHPAVEQDKEPDSNDTSYIRSYSKRSTPLETTRIKPPATYLMGQRRYKKDNLEKSPQPDDTILFLPGVDVRVHYHSGMNTGTERDRVPSSVGSIPHPLFEESSSMIATNLDVDSDSSTLLAQPSADTDSTLWNVSTTNLPSTPSKRLIKCGCLYTWISFQSLPQKMVLKPCLLDFLGQALEPIVPSEDEFVDAGESLTSDGESLSAGDNEATGSLVSSSMSENSSFPVDIVVVIRVQPSEIRFSCLPVSRVECVLNLPDLDVVFSSNSSPNKYLQQSCNRPPSRDQSRLRMDQLDSSSSSGSFSFDSGGISFTVCLSRLSFCIFHPYGKEHDVVGRTPSTDEENADDGASQVRFIPTQAKSGKKDSLSLNVEFIKFNLSRRRLGKAVDFPDDTSRKSGSSDFLGGSSVVKVSGICDIGSANFYYDMRRLNEILDFPKAWYKRSLFSRLFLGKEGVYATRTAATASSDVTDAPPTVRLQETQRTTPLMENPNMERLRTSLGRSVSEDRPESLTPVSSPAKKTHKKVPSTGSSLFGLIPTSPSLFRSVTMSGTRYNLLTPKGPLHSPPTPRRQTFSGEKSHKVGENDRHPPEYSSSDDVDGPTSHSSCSSSGGSKAMWETMIVVALNLSRLDVSTNMSSVMGLTFWSTSDLRASGRLTLTNSGRRNMKARLTVRQAKFGSRSGIVGGHIEMHELVTKVKGNEERGYTPQHSANVQLKYIEARLDYMGTCIWMGNLSAFRTDLRDEWVLHQATSPSTDSLFGNEREEPVNAKIYMHGEMAWNDLKVMICRSTTPDFVKMITKIQEFFAQQHRNSMRALSTLNTPSLRSGNIMSQLSAPINAQSLKKEKTDKRDGLKYQHWSKVLNAVCGLSLSTLNNPLPERGVLLGGSLALQGQSVSLACFHGVNFRAQSWVLFTLSSPFMEFSSRVCSEEKSCQVRRVRAVQNLLIRVGYGDIEESVPGNLSPSSAHIAIVRKVSRGRRNPPSMGSNVQEWLNYVCAMGDEDFSTSYDGVTTERQRTDSTGSLGSRKPTSVRRTSSSYRYEHETEPIFALPKFEVVLKTEHDIPMSSIPSTWARKKQVSQARMMSTPASPHVVECSFTSCFDDSLCVTMDVGLLFFLHDVVQTYIRENETTSSGSLPRGTSPTSRREDKKAGKEDHDTAHKTDPEPKSKRTRQFRSKAWKLEPRVRFLSWAGKTMEPVNIDWVLQKLGFTDAKLTIPKWAQRGAMDPMDLFLSLLIDRLLAGMQESSAYLEDV